MTNGHDAETVINGDITSYYQDAAIKLYIFSCSIIST